MADTMSALVNALLSDTEVEHDPATVRKIRNQALAGRPLTPEQEAYMESLLPGKMARGEDWGNTGRELTGIPAIGRGYESVKTAIEEPTPGNVGRGVRDAGIAAIMATPMGKLGGKAVDGLVSALGAARHSIPAIALGGGLAGASDAANAQDFGALMQKGGEGVSELVKAIMGKDKYAPMTMEEFRAQRLPPIKSDADIAKEATDAAMKSEAYVNMDKTNPRSSTWARTQLVDKAVNQALAAAKTDRATRKEAEAGIPKEYDAYVASLAKNRAEELAKPFVERNPMISGTMAGASVAVPMAMGYRAVRGLGKETEALLADLQKARTAGDTLAEVTAIKGLQQLEAGTAKHLGKTIAEGAAIPAGFRFAPDALDTMFVPPSPDQNIPSASDKVWNKWSSPSHMMHYGLAMIPAAAEGASETIFGMGVGGLRSRPTYGRVRAEGDTLPKPPTGETWTNDRLAQELAAVRSKTATSDLSLSQALLDAREGQRLLKLQSEGTPSAGTRNIPLPGTPASGQGVPPTSGAQATPQASPAQPAPMPQGQLPPPAPAANQSASSILDDITKRDVNGTLYFTQKYGKFHGGAKVPKEMLPFFEEIEKRRK